MRIRKIPFSYPSSGASSSEPAPATNAGVNQHWHKARPEFSHVVNAASIAMPYLEPYLIGSMRKALAFITDENLRTDVELYIKQEATHFREHKKFNETLKVSGYESVVQTEAQLDKGYKALTNGKSLKFNLAYAEGFESMALAIGHMLIEDREFLFAHSDPAVASLILWHFVEEIEHKNVAFDVFKHCHGGYFYRLYGLAYATLHIFAHTRAGYRALLKEDHLWGDFSSRLRLIRILAHIFGKLLPKWLKILRPGYHPSKVKDPEWAHDWAALYNQSPAMTARLDTEKLFAATPMSVA